mmetsp:Transcript_7433/g.22607  ORF Transcript_7433/g.22607 Transcript_7433/m.22607 type:complete len:174 (+) Transcript_7433:411-932(+)|eukprot:CAMPEP_0198731984 /NCGR_PEP_ID=MMETSP1475-20131203/33153_1 /TAXON_ID= ORGANISM="Unidentified sp., Strain CCMP1999" /NCGR_SAMPLE_ID=MMETSP1475 /ASSEMBLY_ACC=CAM_ASM_001111 /LENGTH=173 /DNA_ID=CAMNT_0044495013 /DNA_START=333 /DNA_END=854 /DNA_ORIENTATION=+
MSTLEYVRRAENVQQRRAKAHGKFEAALRDSVAGLQLDTPEERAAAQSKYEAEVAQVTEELVSLNDEMADIVNGTAPKQGYSELHSIVERIQAIEDESVKTRVSIHVLRRSSAAGLRPVPGEELDENSIGERTSKFLRQLNDQLTELNELMSALTQMRLDLAEEAGAEDGSED